MDILNSGSFVPLDNKERMEQLAFTAKTLAIEVSRAEGFQSSGPSNHQLGLEMWNGAQYVCRAHEEATIRNIFLSKFLETLRAIEKQNTVQPRPPQTNTTDSPAIRPLDPVHPQVVTTTTAITPRLSSLSEPSHPSDCSIEQESEDPADEYLGVVSDDDVIEAKRPSYSDECVPECDSDVEAIVDRLDIEHPEPRNDEHSEPNGTGSEQTEIAATANVSRGRAELDDAASVEQNDLSEVVEEKIHTESVDSPEPSPIESLVIHEKEPYNFDGCTVTAVVQLLPEAKGARKCVVSVRTHDFAPSVAVVDGSTADILSQLSGVLLLAFEQYRNELPARAAERLKKEKPAAKKASKPAAKTSKTAVSTPKSDASPTPSAAAAVTDHNQQGLFGA
ncbi:MAG: hypothetical protein ABI878_16235 [Acidobacteriota bacterium]